MQVKGNFNINLWFVLAVALAIGLVFSACRGSKDCPSPAPAPTPPHPLCVLTSAIEEGSTCLPVADPNSRAQYEAKVTLEDKSELYCQIVKKQGLVCKPVQDSPETAGAKEAVRQIQQAQKQQAGSGDTAGSGSAAPKPAPTPAPSK